MIFAFNVFAHTRSVGEFIKCIKMLLDNDGIFIFEAQYLGDIYNKFILGTFFHEHMSHHSVYSLNKAFKENGMRLFLLEKNNIQNGSILGYVTKNENINIDKSVDKYLKYENIENGLFLFRINIAILQDYLNEYFFNNLDDNIDYFLDYVDDILNDKEKEINIKKIRNHNYDNIRKYLLYKEIKILIFRLFE